jgi:peptidoglycan endopeptidase LytE
MTLSARDAETGLQVAFADEIERPGEIAVYTVADGDTILDIANRMGVDPDAIVSVNRLSDSDWIVAGDQLAVPLWARPAQGGEAPVMDEMAGVGVAAEAMLAAVPRTPVTYEVEAGDTVAALAERFGVDADTIVTTNDLISADRIKIGQELTILPVSGLIYSVRPGDTLADIAATFKVDLGPIIDFNYLEDADFISVGKELIIPGARPLPPPRPSTPTVYEVQPGDTISTIALRFGVTAADIVAANGLRSPDRIAIGDKLTIKAGAGGSSGTSSAVSQQTVTRNLPVPAAPASSTAARQSTPGAGGSISSIAMQFQGSRYVFGGTTPSGFDCSGFVYYVVNRSGKSLSRGMWGQYNAGFHPGRGELQPGDIVFFQNTYMAGLSHNGIYIGGGQFIHASDERSGVKISSLSESYWASRWFGATRVW